MTLKLDLVVALAVAMIVRPGPGWAQTEERAVYVSVLDQDGSPVSDLAASDFIVREGGVERDVLRVSTATDPLQIAVLVDTSQAIEPYVSEIRSALKSFSREIQDRHERALFAFAERPVLVADYSRDPARLEAGIGRLFGRTGGGASVVDAIIEVSRGLRQRGATRQAIVVITTEDHQLSDRDRQSMLENLRETNATLHSFLLGKPGTSMTLRRRLQGLAADLNNQYLVAYAQPRTGMSPDALDVSVRRAGLTVRAEVATQKRGATCWIVETNTSRAGEFFGYQCR
jgi:hypothetical protein